MMMLHPPVDLEEWVDEWVDDALTVGVTIELFDEYMDMATRHPRFFGRHVHAPSGRQTPARGLSVSVPAGVEQWRSLVAQWFRPGEVDRALRIMACESGGNPNARNPRSSASGLFQHLAAKYWTARSAAAGFAGASVFNPVANVATAAWLRDQRGGWSHWVCRG